MSTHITLPGRAVVLTPTVEYVGVSRRIDEEERERLRERMTALKPEGMGAIVRTAGRRGRDPDDDLRAEIEQLSEKWREISLRAHAIPARLSRYMWTRR